MTLVSLHSYSTCIKSFPKFIFLKDYLLMIKQAEAVKSKFFTFPARPLNEKSSEIAVCTLLSHSVHTLCFDNLFPLKCTIRYFYLFMNYI